jgi:hypothetical protein
MLRVGDRAQLNWSYFQVAETDKYSVFIKGPGSLRGTAEEDIELPITWDCFMENRYKDGIYIIPDMTLKRTGEFDEIGNEMLYHLKEHGFYYYIVLRDDFAFSGVYYLDNADNPYVARLPRDPAVYTRVKAKDYRIEYLTNERKASWKINRLPSGYKLRGVIFNSSSVNGKIQRIYDKDSNDYTKNTTGNSMVVLSNFNLEITIFEKHLKKL